MSHLFDIEHGEREPDRDWDRDLYFEEVLRPRWNRMVKQRALSERESFALVTRSGADGTIGRSRTPRSESAEAA